MTDGWLGWIWRLGGVLGVVLVAGGSTGPAVDPRQGVVGEIWQGDLARRLAVADRLADSLSFDELFASLELGPSYNLQVPVGRVQGSHEVRGLDHPYLVLVPDGYDPRVRTPVRIYLHGGVARRNLPADGEWWQQLDRLASRLAVADRLADSFDTHIAVFPAAWSASKWWQESQLANLGGLLTRLKMAYNVDENRVHVVGVSDGGTGAWYIAFRDPTPWAGFIPIIGHPAVLASPQVEVEGQMHVVNLRIRSFLVFNGELDRLYPARSVRPYVDLFREAEVDVEFVELAGEGHTVEWFPQHAGRIDTFVEETPRDPLPSRISWETEDAAKFSRVHWLMIDALGLSAGDAPLPDIERRLPGTSNLMVGFPRYRPSGRVEATAAGNEIEIHSRGVRRVRLLLSPRQFDLSRPVRVHVNGVQRHVGVVTPDRRTLLRWAARDLDRSMLFGAELEIRIPASSEVP